MISLPWRSKETPIADKSGQPASCPRKGQSVTRIGAPNGSPVNFAEAFGWEPAPRYMVRDQNRVYGNVFIRRLGQWAFRDRGIAPRSPWQNGYSWKADRLDPTGLLSVFEGARNRRQFKSVWALLRGTKLRKKKTEGWLGKGHDGIFSNGPNISYCASAFGT